MEGVEAELYMLIEMPTKATEVLEPMQANSRAGWKDCTKKRKECSCSRERELEIEIDR